MKRMIVLSLAGVSLMALASLAYAGPPTKQFGWDYKVTPGNSCAPQIGAQSADFERYPFSIRNVADKTPRTVICPVVRDSWKGTEIDFGILVTKGVRCDAYVMNKGGNQEAVLATYLKESVDIDREIQYFKTPKGKTSDGGYYSFQCTLPAGAEVFQLVTGELSDSTDWGN